MWTHAITILSVIGFLITAAGLVGVSFRVGRNAQTVSNYRESAEAWEMKSRAQADEITELQAKLAANDIIIKKLQDRLQVLEEMVTGQAAVTALAATMDKYAANIDKSFMGLQSHIDSALSQVRKDIRGSHG